MSDSEPTATTGPPSPALLGQDGAQQRRRPMPRKGHTKSRAGCPSCKRRKVKCDEVAPECGPCRRLGLECAFLRTSPRSRGTTPASTSPSTTASLTRSLTTRPGSFDLTDLHFFQHFLVSAYPPLPIGGWAVWQGISQMSHEYNFLAHSMLGLGASHLSLLSPARHTQAALRHRVIAIRCLNESLSRTSRSVADTDAAFAAILALTFQAAHMPDGLNDFLTMIRGCFLVGSIVEANMQSTTFKTFERDVYVESAVQLVATDGPHRLLDHDLAAGFGASLEQLGPLCRSVAEVEYLAIIRKTVSSILSDVFESYRQHARLYEKLVLLSVEEFNTFIDPSSHVSQLVIAHMLILDCVMSGNVGRADSRHGDLPSTNRRYDARNAMTCVWVENIAASLPVEYRGYAHFPVRCARTLMQSFEADTSFWKPLLLEERETSLPELDYADSAT